MHKFFTPSENISESEGKILGDDVKHIYKVLRLEPGEKVILNNCKGKEFLGQIASVTKESVAVKIIEELQDNNESPINIFLFQGLPKAQKMDLIVQKGTELGITKFIPTITKRVDIKLKGEFKKLDRLNRIALEAAKQSKRSIIPEVSEPITFEEALVQMASVDLFIVPYENAENYGIKAMINDLQEKGSLKDIKTVGIMVGPEGGFEEDEINKLKENGAYIITLGSRILRTETAGFTATSLLQYELGDLGGNI
jgi:16S rRNA (uracil1498-N3)-methyltransferase